MRTILTHTLSGLVGAVLAAYACLFFSSLASFTWQDELKIRAAYALRLEGARAAQANNWALASGQFHSASEIALTVGPRTWGIGYPLHAWRLTGFAKDPDDTFLISDLSIEAYSMQKQGNLDGADKIYNELIKKNPSKNKEYFEGVAEQTLSTLNAPIAEKGGK
ncbi:MULTISPECIES: hypothetical protein [Burkholderia cepacia complex]|uniref:hypothetical protein n=1 Tax=Burkholderia cepacia complex TaxID=87882 RepID=UPI0012BB0A8C|nr:MULTISPECIES: hypothetical protein [Burkholderia cepacia complex]